MNYEQAKEKVKDLVPMDEGVFKMCEEFDKYASKYALIKLVDAADNLINNHNFTIEEACKVQGITIEEYKAIEESKAVLV